MPRIRYSPESVVIPDTPVAILEWAASHIEHVGIHQGHGLFDGPGRTVTLACWPRGAISVAAGNGRGSSRHTYDWDRIQRAEDEALRLVAEHLVDESLDLGDSTATKDLHRQVLDQWSAVEGRTADETARAFRAAAEHTDCLF